METNNFFAEKHVQSDKRSLRQQILLRYRSSIDRKRINNGRICCSPVAAA